MENDKGGDEKERKGAENQECADSRPLRVEAAANEVGADSEKQHDAEQWWKILREWLTIGGLFSAAAAAFYQIVIFSQQASLLSKQADALVGQLAEMRSAAEQTDKLIASNADLAAAAKAQATALQQSAVTAHDSLVMSQRARLASSNVSLEALQVGQPAKGTAVYSSRKRACFGRRRFECQEMA